MFYPFFWKAETEHLGLEKQSNQDIEILPMKTHEEKGRWRWGIDTSKKNLENLYARYMPNKNQWSIFEKDYLEGRDDVKPTSVWDFKDVNSERGTETFINLGFQKEDFPNPKPVGTVERVLTIATKHKPNALLS